MSAVRFLGTQFHVGFYKESFARTDRRAELGTKLLKLKIDEVETKSNEAVPYKLVSWETMRRMIFYTPL